MDKILIWNTNFLRDGGGSQKVTHFLAKGLQEYGYQVTIVCNKFDDRPQNPVFGSLPPEVRLYQDEFLNPWESLSNPISFLWELFNYFKASIRFLYFLRREKFLLVHLNYVSWDICLLSLCKVLFKFPMVISFLGGEIDLAPQEKLSKIKIKIALLTADLVTAVSKSLCDEIQHSFNFADVIHLPFYFNPVGWQQHGASKHPSKGLLIPMFEGDNFVFCGRISPEKRVPFLIESFKEAIMEGCGKKLYIIGDGEEFSKSFQLVENFKLQKQIIFLGLLPYQTAQEIIRQCRCLILCSRTESNPQVVLEAMSWEKPVICSSIPGVSQIVINKETGLLFEGDRKDSLRDLILRISRDDEYGQKLGKTAGCHIKKLFAEQDYTEQIMKLYCKVSLMDG